MASSSAVSRILGLDPGLQVTGYGVIEIGPGRVTVVEAGVVRSDESAELSVRVKALYDGVLEVIDQWQPAAVAIEQLYAHYEHPRTAILMGHARGVYLLAGAQRGLPVFSYAATMIKKRVTGSGRATKEQMQHCVMRELGLSKVPEPHDVADALAVALCHHFASGHFVSGTKSARFTGVNRAMLKDAKGEAD